MVAPLVGRHGVIGMMAVWRAGDGARLHQADLDFLVGLSQQAAIAIDNARLFADANEARAGGRRREPGEERLPRRDEPRDPDADERDHRHERPAARHAARRRAARLRRHDPDLGRRPAHDHQRHPRLLEDRGRARRPRPRAVRARRLHRGCARPDRRRPRRRRASSSPTRSTATCRRRSSATRAGCARSS